MSGEVCKTCGLIHPPLIECMKAQADAMADLLLKIGGIDTCDCGECIFWVTLLSGKRRPYTKAGLVHFANCTGKFKDRRGTHEPIR